jgi:predicted HTH transcriptional regulator
MVKIDFVSSYIKKAVQKGYSSPEEICNFARKEIAEIDEKLNEAELLRIEREKIKKVFKYYGTSLTPAPKIDSNELEEFTKKIVAVIKEHPPMTNRELIQKLGFGTDVLTIKGLKLLSEKQVVERDKSEDNRIVKGPNFDKFIENISI